MANSITKNTTLLTGASILQKVVSFVYFTLVARYLGAGDTSQYFLALSFISVFTVIGDFGITPSLTRELSKFPEKARTYLNSVFWIKMLFGILAYGLIFVSVSVLNYPDFTKRLIMVAGLTVLFDNLNMVAYAYLRSIKNLVYESAAIFLSQLTTLIVGAVVLFTKGSMLWLVGAYAIPSFINFFVLLGYLKIKYQIAYAWQLNKNIIKTFLLIALPFALAGIISRLYSYTDTVIMSKVLSKEELGWWSVPYKIVFAFQFLPAALTVSVYPVMSRAYLENKARVAALYERAWQYLLLISVPMAFGLLVVARAVVLKVYTAGYWPSVLALQILGFAIIFIFLSYINGALLNATGHQKLQTSIVAISWVASTILNLLLIPHYGIYGAAATALFTNALAFFIGYGFIGKFIPLPHLEILTITGKAILAAIIMAIVVFVLEKEVSFILAVPVGAVVYAILLLLFGAVSKQTIKDTLIKIGIIKPQL